MFRIPSWCSRVDGTTGLGLAPSWIASRFQHRGKLGGDCSSWLCLEPSPESHSERKCLAKLRAVLAEAIRCNGQILPSLAVCPTFFCEATTAPLQSPGILLKFVRKPKSPLSSTIPSIKLQVVPPLSTL